MAHTEKGTYCRQGWPVTSPSRWTPVCWAVDHLRPWPDWGRMPLWVWGCHLKHLNQKGAGQRERKGKEMDGRVRGWGRGKQNRWRHNTTKIKTNTQQHIQCTHMDRENMLSMNEAERKKSKKKTHLAQTVWGECVESTHPVMHMPCKKPRPQGESVINPRAWEKRKKKPWDHEQHRTQWGWWDSRCLMEHWKHPFLHAKLMMLHPFNYYTQGRL